TIFYVLFVFFFSSRRRHTRSKRDWSSDVCSSDLRVFDLIYVLTGGGPANSTESISVYAYKILFAQQNFGEGSTLSVIVFLCVALISFIYVKLIGSDLFGDRTK